MSVSAVGRLAKPKLRRNLLDSLKVHIPLAICVAFCAQLSLKFFVADVREQKIAQNFRDYDVEKEDRRLKRIGFYDKIFEQFD